ncbi:HAMP domain-containing sensor histidine kinase [Oceanirhabdus seepicola]|uniref:histidine kinase n=1 Tax=Oceanirhabdus seepicola TaxID=2828781 RepID=A0A9J6NXC5_9CLOT|nr:HAMP domain-containing sensor histidine kinase [Oceanirhabdus seepicola]MCM1988708.1 HAMP domain-containing histidine kinase [Oceanirhabdus seepicola]
MKFWQKIFIYSLILFLIAFNLGGYFLIEKSHNLNLEREIDRGLSEHYSIYTGIIYYTIFPSGLNPNSLSDSNKDVMINYLKSFNNKNMYLEVLDEDNSMVFSNLDFHIYEEREEIKSAIRDKRKYIIRDIGDKTFLFITNLVDVNGDSFKFTYIRDVTYVYEDKQNQYNIFIELEIIISIILAIGMYMLSKYITIPIEQLINSTKIISKGNYSERVHINSKDEIGLLAENFNEMSSAIDEKINELNTKAEEKQRFIDNFTHELKTPLTSIIGYADFLRSTSYNQETFIEGLNHIFKEGKRLEELSWKMMDLTLLKKENFKMKNENIRNVLLDIKEAMKPKLQNKDINLVISAKDYEVFIEKDLIKNLVINLIDNSIKASKEGSDICLNVYKNIEKKIVIEIKDEGIGITKEDLPKVFEAFYMVDKSRTRANNGAGLGLSICAEIAKIHGAELKIDSELNQGTSIKVIFN